MEHPPRRIAADMMPVPTRIMLFRSCTGSLEYPGTEKAIREVLQRLGIEVYMSPDQTCCSGYLLTCNAVLPQLSLAVTARNLAIAEEQGLDIYSFCNGCFGYNTELQHLLETQPEMRRQADEMLAPMGWQYHGRCRVYHVQELYSQLKDRLAVLATRPLRGIRVAVHYGCHYLAKKFGILDDTDYPTFIEDIILALGGIPVYYPERRSCCGAAVGRGFTHREEISLPHVRKKLLSLKAAAPDVLVTVCPGCNVQLDREQTEVEARGWGKIDIPVIDLAQLIALSLGVDPAALGFEANTISLAGLLAKLDEEVRH